MEIPQPIIGIVVTAFLTLLGVVWKLLRDKDTEQQKEIELLFKKHDEDAQRLTELELSIARRQYVTNDDLKQFMSELLRRFDRFEEKLDGKVDK